MRQRGTVEKRNGTWTVRYYDRAGRRRRQSGFRTKAEAVKWLDGRLERLRKGDRRDDSTVQMLVDDFLELHEAAPSRLDDLDYSLRHITRHIGGTEVDKVTPELLIQTRTKIKAESGDSVAYRSIQALRQVFDAAISWRWLDYNPASAVKNPAPKRVEIVPFKDWDEVQSVAEELPDIYTAIPIVAAGTGLRPQEWRRLQWKNVDWNNRVLVLPKTLVKARTPARRVPLTDDVMLMLEQQQELTGHRELVFTTPSGAPIDLHVWRYRHWGPACERAGVGKHRPYDLRHSFATWQIANGLNLFELSRVMGASVATIDKHYGHLAHDSDERIRSVLGSSVGPNAPDGSIQGSA